MEKREFIEPCEIVYTNAPIAPILQGDSIHYEDIAFNAQIKRIASISEQDIVKPYLDKIKSYTDHLRNCGMGKSKSLDFMDKFVDGLLLEQGDKE